MENPHYTSKIHHFISSSPSRLYFANILYKIPTKPAAPANTAIPAPAILAAAPVNCGGVLVVKVALPPGMIVAVAVG